MRRAAVTGVLRRNYCGGVTEAKIVCIGCGGTLSSDDDVRQVYRELADAVDSAVTPDPRWAYTHIGHEPAGTAHRITGRGRLTDLELTRLRTRQSPRSPGG